MALKLGMLGMWHTQAHGLVRQVAMYPREFSLVACFDGGVAASLQGVSCHAAHGLLIINDEYRAIVPFAGRIHVFRAREFVGRESLGCGNEDFKRAPFSWGAVDFERSLVAVYDPGDCRQPEAAAGELGREERLEDAR